MINENHHGIMSWLLIVFLQNGIPDSKLFFFTIVSFNWKHLYLQLISATLFPDFSSGKLCVDDCSSLLIKWLIESFLFNGQCCLMRKLLFLFLIPLLSAGGNNPAIDKKGENNTPDTVLVYYLGGQSNMEGFGYNKDLPAELKEGSGNVWIFNGNHVPDNGSGGGSGLWTELKPGNGMGFSSDGITNIYSDRFGPELSFGSAISKLNPGRKIALIKYARGGTSLQYKTSAFGTWNPDFSIGRGQNQYDFFLKTVHSALSVSDIDSDGRPDVLVPAGIIWMQGESDADHTMETAGLYKANLKQMMQLFRAALHNKNLPVVIGLIADSKMDEDGKMMDYLEVVQQAQREFVLEDKNAAIVESTLGYSFLTDKWHYTSADYIDLGEKFAESLILLTRK
ncbi:MAG: carbohydrate esterase [Bacteroidetes bacterium]|nr:MAG: carbohydrate esterase [Bacteroidota bacterium]